MNKIILIVISLFAILTVIAGCNNNEVYRLIKVKSFDGAVTVEREEKMNAFEGLQLISEDKVEVGNASFLELLVDSDKHIVAEENTAFKLLSSGNEKSGNITVEMLYGKSLFTIDNKLSADSDFIVKTPNVMLSVRGTSYQVNYSPDTEESHIEVFDGVVHVQWAGGQKLLGQGGEMIVSGVDDNIVADIISEGVIQPVAVDDRDMLPPGAIKPPVPEQEVVTITMQNTETEAVEETGEPIELGEDIPELPDNGRVTPITIPQEEFEAGYVEAIIELTPENSMEYFEIIEKDGKYHFVLKAGYGFYTEQHSVKTDHGDFYYEKNYSRYLIELQGGDVQNWIKEWTAEGTIVKYSVPDDMWCRVGDIYFFLVKMSDGRINTIER